MIHQDAIGMMPPHPATWTQADLIAATGASAEKTKRYTSRSVKMGDTEVVRRGSIHGHAIYRRLPGRPFPPVIRRTVEGEPMSGPADIEHVKRFVPNSVWQLGTMSPSVAG